MVAIVAGVSVGLEAEQVIETLKFAARTLAEDAACLKRSHQIMGSVEWDCDEAKQEFFELSRHSFRLFQIVRELKK